ncbi:DUF4349 domain-containing protein [Psychrobacter frigidicola]|uniref:DUF4349 domain-containing protein n=2 Tax=Psychrobacter frigidicola TaxID=45611 RepID=A0A5C7AC05_9GAMM|nr:DUF4349 domain-containing protein [Psychrobacter frigidicola]
MQEVLTMTSLFNLYQHIDSYNHINNHAIKNTTAQAYLSFIGILALSLLLVTGCSDNSQYSESSTDVSYEESVQASEDMGGTDADMNAMDAGSDEQQKTLTVENIGGDSAQSLDTQVTGIEIEGKTLLVNVNANFKVADVVKSSSAIEKLTQQQGGYVALSDISNNETDRRTFAKGAQNITFIIYQRQANMTVRIPKVNVKTFLQQIQAQVAFLNEQSLSAQDVTLDIYRQQLAAKLNNDMAAELEQERLKSQNAKDQSSNVNAITATYTAREQQQYAKLEQLDIADKVKYSTITLSFNQPASSYKETTQNIDLLIDVESPSFANQVSNAFKTGWETLKLAIITLIGLWWLLVVMSIFYLLYRLVKKSYQTLVSYKREQKIKPVPYKKKPLPDNKIDTTED